MALCFAGATKRCVRETWIPLVATKFKMDISSIKVMFKVIELGAIWKRFQKLSMHAKYQVSISYRSKVMAKVKLFLKIRCIKIFNLSTKFSQFWQLSKTWRRRWKFKVNFYIVVQFIHLSKDKFLSYYVTLVTRSFRHHKISWKLYSHRSSHEKLLYFHFYSIMILWSAKFTNLEKIITCTNVSCVITLEISSKFDTCTSFIKFAIYEIIGC